MSAAYQWSMERCQEVNQSLTKKSLRGEENKLVRSDAYNVAILTQGGLNGPRISSGKPSVPHINERCMFFGLVAYQ